ncbi:MAG TPA: DNA primase [Oligoflexia bacterium]|nr:DNA primase [Oligoflexia bacterium]
MPLISKETIEAVKERADLVEIISEQTKLQARGSNFVGLCPFHSEKTPSFFVRAGGKGYHCFGCGASGSVFNFIMQTKGVSFPEAIELLAERYSVPIKYERGLETAISNFTDREALYKINLLAHNFFRQSLNSAPSVVKEYLKKRGLSKELIEFFGVGFAPNDWRALYGFLKAQAVPEKLIVASQLCKQGANNNFYDTFRARLIFPVFIDGKKIAGFGGRIVPDLMSDTEKNSSPKYLNSPETLVYQKSKILYGWPHSYNQIKNQNEVIIVEGYLDLLSLWREGVRNVVAVCGTALSFSHVKKISYAAKNALVVFDGDVAGNRAAARSFESFLNTGVDGRALFLPAGDDPDSIAAKHRDQTSTYLRGLPKRDLIDCYIDYLILKYQPNLGEDIRADREYAKIGELGSAVRGQIAIDLADLVGGVKNPFERDALLERAAFRLKLENLQKIKETSKNKASESISQQVSVVQEGQLLSVDQLPLEDRELLMALFLLKEEAFKALHADLDLQSYTHPHTWEVKRIFESIILLDCSEEEKKEKIKKFLSMCGSSWEKFWRECYKGYQAERINPHKILAQIPLKRQMQALKQTVAELAVMMKVEEDPQAKSELALLYFQAVKKEKALSL